MPIEQSEKARAFRDLHDAPGAFVIPNPWDAGSARILAALGYQALATTSAGAAFSLGRRDGGIGRDATLANARAIVEATDLPVSADLENGFGDSPAEAALTIRLAADTGLVGGSIEDTTGRDDEPIYPFDLAVDRVAAAVEAARSLPFPFTLTARAEGFLHGRGDLDDIVRRLQAFEKAGADVLYAPALPSLDAIRTVCASVGKPVNVLAARPGLPLSVADLEAAGVKRISLGSQFALAALGGFVRAAKEVRERGTFDFAADALPFGEASGFMAPDVHGHN